MKGWFDAIAANDTTIVAKSRLVFMRTSDSLGMTGLMLAASRGHSDIVNLLVDAEHNLKDANGKLASNYALENKHYIILDTLLQYEWTDSLAEMI